jgi:hypothetical protein
MMEWTKIAKMLIFSACLCFLINSVVGFPTNENYSDDQEYQYDQYDTDYDGDGGDEYNEEIQENLEPPVITTIPQTFDVDEGKTIRLPCEVNTLGDHGLHGIPVMWYKDDISNTIVIDKNAVNGDKRIEVKVTDSGSTLLIGAATSEDAGKYICQIASNDKPEIKHSVIIHTPPSVTIKSTVLDARKGDDITLACEGEGSPPPTVKWTRQGKNMPDGSPFIEKDVLTFTEVSRKHEGLYLCTASNGFGKDASKTVLVDIKYKPEIEVEEVFIHSQTGDSAELVCNVHASPHPTVVWKKNGALFTASAHANIKMNNYGHKHTLTIESVTKQDFGEYSCFAENTLGSYEAKMEISGKAGPARFKSNPKGIEPTSFLLEWTSMSYSPITEFALEYKEYGQDWVTTKVTPTMEDSVAYHFAGKDYLSNLQPATSYEAQVKAKNDEGWSKYTTFEFATKGAEPRTESNKSDAGAASQSSLTSLILVVSLFLTLWK